MEIIRSELTAAVCYETSKIKLRLGTLTIYDSEKPNLLDKYFCTIAVNLIGPTNKIQPIQVRSHNINSQTPTNLTIEQKEIEEKIGKLKGKKTKEQDGVPPRLLKFAGRSNTHTFRNATYTTDVDLPGNSKIYY